MIGYSGVGAGKGILLMAERADPEGGAVVDAGVRV